MSDPIRGSDTEPLAIASGNSRGHPFATATAFEPKCVFKQPYLF